jgi:hypothetical protein
MSKEKGMTERPITMLQWYHLSFGLDIVQKLHLLHRLLRERRKRDADEH